MNLEILAKEYGFADSYLLPFNNYEDWLRHRNDGVFHPKTGYIESEPKVRYAGANAVLLLVMPYKIQPKELHISSYYLASNLAYHAMMSLKWRLEAEGVWVDKADIPLRTIALEAGIGTLCHNALLALPNIGTRFALQGIALKLEQPQYSGTDGMTFCDNCGLCEKACPNKAIDKNGYHFERCARAYMDEEDMPVWAMEGMTTLFGCDLCQNCCPLNKNEEYEAANEQYARAFDLERLLLGDTREALALVGKNMKKGRLLNRQAAIMAGKLGRKDLLPILQNLRENAEPKDASVYDWAISLLI